MAVDRRWIDVGTVCGVFGVQGWIKVFSWTEPRDNVFSYSPWRLAKAGANTERRVSQWRHHGKGLIAKLEGIDRREEAERLSGMTISVARQQLAPLPAGQYYWSDLVGLVVQNRDGYELGRVESLLETGAHDVLVVGGERERLIPFALDQVVEHVDLAAGTIRVDWDPDY